MFSQIIDVKKICKYCEIMASMFYRYLSSLKINFVSAHLKYFPDNCVDYNDE